MVIDYATGESHLSGEEPEETPAGEANYILNTNTMKFHLPTCASVADIKPANRGTVATREEALAAGYEPCGRCNP